jgi:hypothetical protein
MYLYLAPHVPDEKYAASLAFLSVPKANPCKTYIRSIICWFFLNKTRILIIGPLDWLLLDFSVN